ncbi:TetR/AcrR family transcriptional regulator [Erysipelotrichaceae bacterium RD49]|nr:TetR/AcrR family transcriptional regulator [Erysipelotrichaceae bacterium RD49]
MKRKADLNQIYQNSRDLFLRKGYDAVKVDEICASVGITKPTFYAFKINKRDLLIHAYQAPEKEEIKNPDQMSDDQIHREIFRILDLVTDQIFKNGPDLLRDLLRLHFHESCLDSLLTPNWRQVMIKLISVGQKRKLIHNQCDPLTITKVIAAYITGYSFQYAMQQAEESRTNLHEGVDVILQIGDAYES